MQKHQLAAQIANSEVGQEFGYPVEMMSEGVWIRAENSGAVRGEIQEESCVLLRTPVEHLTKLRQRVYGWTRCRDVTYGLRLVKKRGHKWGVVVCMNFDLIDQWANGGKDDDV